MANKTRKESRIRRKIHIRKVVIGTALRPRVSVFRSNRYLYAQLIDDHLGNCLAGLSEKSMAESKTKKLTGKPIERASKLGTDFAKLIKKTGAKEIVFDRSGYRYHGRIAAFADAIRKQGINF